MSVAFRRESDEEHLEPKFELPVPPGPNLVTERGLALIEARVAEYEALDAATDDQKRTMRYWRRRLASAQLAPPPPAGEVGFGSRVAFTLNGKKREVRIVGEDEADPAAGLIGLQAPLAQALIGAGAGEILPFAGKEDAIEIVAIGQ
ncbi:GreA/GreB family elongation factor [Sphingomonas crusticola]|uniref:GreA/GreB family elongation factor n=1 Tax=Sphingomonas crusticola TaxID=1697973 RepID=UPI000E243CB7|nr:GreA/GreB family elongation factor [Sphingomonas crusticola]